MTKCIKFTLHTCAFYAFCSLNVALVTQHLSHCDSALSPHMENGALSLQQPVEFPLCLQCWCNTWIISLSFSRWFLFFNSHISHVSYWTGIHIRVVWKQHKHLKYHLRLDIMTLMSSSLNTFCHFNIALHYTNCQECIYIYAFGINVLFIQRSLKCIQVLHFV